MSVDTKRLPAVHAKGGKSLWQKLVEPAPSIQDVAEGRQSRLLSSAIIILAPLFAVQLIVSVIVIPNYDIPVVVFVGYLTFVGGYFINRSGRCKLAAAITVAAFPLVILSMIVVRQGSGASTTLTFMVVSLVIASIFLSVQGVITLAAANSVGTLLLPLLPLETRLGFSDIVLPLSLNIAVAVLSVVSIRHRNAVERDRQAELVNANEALAASIKKAQTATAMAREANRLKSEFLATMSHELRTPLNAIIGFTEIMLAGMAGPLNDKHKHKISRIHLNSKRLLSLINDLLDLAKIEAGRVEVLREPFSPARLAAKLEAEMESLAEQRELAFEVLVDKALPPQLVGDAPRIEQAVSNLLSNAFKFTSKGGVTLKLSANGSDTWLVSVTDTGIGVPPHAIEYIFDEFRQVDTGSQRAYGGSGLGLSITRNLARIMGGDVRVSSTLSEGSTFTLVLPMIVAESEQLEEAV